MKNKSSEDARRFNISFKWLNILNGRVFKKARIPLSKQGLVSILGKNGAGKSTIGNLIEAIVYGSTASGHKKNDLVQNDNKANYTLEFDKADKTYSAELQRLNKKWSYTIYEGDGKINHTPHSLKDGPAKIAEILNLTKPEFEGSVHLTQDAQHILISGKLAQRKEYISNFFGIDYRYDHILEVAKEELGKVKDKIKNVAALSHSEDLLKNELESLMEYTEDKKIETEGNVSEVVNKIKDFQVVLGRLRQDYEDRQLYDEHSPLAFSVDHPEKKAKAVEQNIIELKAKKSQADQIKDNNANALRVNASIDGLEKIKAELAANFKGMEEKVNLKTLGSGLEQLKLLRQQDINAQPLRQELAQLPQQEEIPLNDTELRKVQVQYQEQLNKMKAIKEGKCDKCGAEYTDQDINEVDHSIADLKEAIDLLVEDTQVIRVRNQKVQRRKFLEGSLAKIPIFNIEQEETLKELTRFIPAKKEYDETCVSLNILQRAELQPEIDLSVVDINIQNLSTQLAEIQWVMKAMELLPEKLPKATLAELHDKLGKENMELTASETKKSELERELGEITVNCARKKEVEKQIAKLRAKLDQLEDLKKEEFYWAKLADAYGPKGLRLQHLNKMMDLIIKQLPVYAGILFNEKGLSFKYRCEPNSVEIIAHRQRINAKGVIEYFEHDIALFSGGEKSRMSIALILTLADCVPIRKRANMLILDEVDSDIDDDGRFRFVNSLLPMLKKKYESIFVISHSSDIQQAMIYNQVWTITKKNHWATIAMKKVG